MDRDKPAAAAANDPELVHGVLFEEVNADAERCRGLRLPESKPGEARVRCRHGRLARDAGVGGGHASRSGWAGLGGELRALHQSPAERWY
jgi:hypothetical protein